MWLTSIETVGALNLVKMVKSSLWVRGSACLCAVLYGLSPLGAERARAFGGFWSSADARVGQSAEQIVFVDHPDATITAVVRIRYVGPAKTFAWILPVPGRPKVSISSSAVFERLEAATAPQYWVEQTIEDACKDAQPGEAPGAGPGLEAPAGPSVTAPGGVAVVDQGAVGPYQYVTLQASAKRGDPARAALEWLRAHGFAADGGELLAPYLREGQNLLAFKLIGAADGGAIRPLMLTYEREQPSIPLLPSAHAARAPMPVQVWVFGPSQAVPENYRSLVLNDARIDWLTASSFPKGTLPANGVGPFRPQMHKPINYDALVSDAVNEAGGRAFVTELGGPASQYRSKVWSDLDAWQLKILLSQTFADSVDLVAQAKLYYGNWDGWLDTLKQTVALPKGVTPQAFSDNPARYRGQAKVDAGKFLVVLQEQVVKPVTDVASMLNGTPYLTRLFSTVTFDTSSVATTIDPVFTYNADLAQVSQVHIAKQTIECDGSLALDAAPWRVVLPQDGVVRGAALLGWPAAPEGMPFNLKVVMLSNRGAGTVLVDNSALIGKLLYERALRVGHGEALPPRPQVGVRIGGMQTVSAPITHDAKGYATSAPKPYVSQSAPKSGAARISGGGRCSVARVSASGSRGNGLWLAGVLALLALRRRAARTGFGLACAWAVLLCCACRDEGPAGARNVGTAAPRDPRELTREQLRNPDSCKECHPIHFRDWSSSMHAYSARDPVFIAMNQRGQRETHGELGDLCIKCHAPMAVVDKLSKDGLNLDQLPDRQRGVSCYFCHNVTGIEGDHNAMLTLGNDTIMRGPIADPFTPHAHLAEPSEVFDQNHPRSSAMCGGCHDLVLPNGVHLERTFQEYRDGLFSKSATGKPPPFETCVSCHMPGARGAAAEVPGAPERLMHEHLWPGIDVPLIDAPNSAALRSAVEDCQLGAQSFSYFSLEVTPPDLFSFQLETNAGHNQPSGASQDRRMWLEFLAYDKDGKLLDASSGNIGDDDPEDKHERDPSYDPHLLMFRDRIFDAQAKEVHMFWEAAPSPEHPDGFEASALPVASTTYVEGKHSVFKQYRASGPDGTLPARVTARLRMRAIARDVLDDLVASGDLDPAIAGRMPTLNFGAKIEWTPNAGMMKTVYTSVKSECGRYRCLLDPSLPACR